MGVDIFIIYVCILIPKICFDFFLKKLVFKPLRCYSLSVVVCWLFFVALGGIFVSKGLIKSETAVSKKAFT